MQRSGFLIMGVSGSGKTTLGKALAQKLGWDFFDADDFHDLGNIAKMTAGIPLSDSDRGPWLAALHDHLLSTLGLDRHPVLACSALKNAYHTHLLEGLEGMAVSYLRGSYNLIRSRMSARERHYMKPQMLQSQFDILEKPGSAVVLDVEMPVQDMVDRIKKRSKKVIEMEESNTLDLRLNE